MKLKLILSSCLFLSLAHADENPNIQCSFQWDLRNEQGVSVENKAGKVTPLVKDKEIKATLKNFEYTAKLDPIVAQGFPNGPDKGIYNLNINLKKGDVEVLTSSVINSKKVDANPYRTYLILVVGKERGFFTCDYTKP